MPSGCIVQLEKVAKEIVLDNIRKQSSGKKWFRNEVREFLENYGKNPSLENIVDLLEVTPSEIYNELLEKGKTLSTLRGDTVGEESEKRFSYALKNLVDNNNRDSFGLILNRNPISERDNNYLYASYFSTLPPKNYSKKVVLESFLKEDHPVYGKEIKELLHYKAKREMLVSGVDEHGLTRFATYTNAQIVASFPGMGNLFTNQSGVMFVKSQNNYVIFITLDKNENDYSPLTMYQDYFVNNKTIHWEGPHNRNQSLAFAMKNSKGVLIFVRKSKKDSNYYYLGPGHSEEFIGEYPIKTYFNLDGEVPANIYAKLI